MLDEMKEARIRLEAAALAWCIDKGLRVLQRLRRRLDRLAIEERKNRAEQVLRVVSATTRASSIRASRRG